MLGRMYGSHLYGLHRLKSKGYGLVYVIVDMPLVLYVVDMLIISAEHNVVYRKIIFNNALYKGLRVSFRAAFPYEYLNTYPKAFPHFLYRNALVVVGYTGGRVYIKLLSEPAYRVPVYNLSPFKGGEYLFDILLFTRNKYF